MRGEAQRQQRPHGGEDAERIGVADRLREAIEGDLLEARSRGRKQPARQRLDRQPDDPRQQTGEKMGDRVSAHDQQRGQHADEVDHRSLDLENRLLDVTRPGDRDRDPAGHEQQRRQEGQFEAPERHPGTEDEGEARHPCERENAPAPGGGEVAAVGSPDRHDEQE